MIIELIRWWYSAGWILTLKNITDWPKDILRHFSVPILLRTYFAPWRRIVTPPGKTIDMRIRAAIDNFISRIVGSIVRFLVLLTAGLMVILSFVAGIAMVVIWPLMPISFIALIIKGIVG